MTYSKVPRRTLTSMSVSENFVISCSTKASVLQTLFKSQMLELQNSCSQVLNHMMIMKLNKLSCLKLTAMDYLSVAFNCL